MQTTKANQLHNFLEKHNNEQQYNSLSLSILTAISPAGPGLASTRMSPFWILLELSTMEVLVTTGNCKAPVKSLPSTNQHPAFYRPDALPEAQPTTVSQH